MSDGSSAAEVLKILFSIYRNGRKVEGNILGLPLPQNTRFIVNFQDAESVFVEARPSDTDGSYQFVWAAEGVHQYIDLFSSMNELILKHYTLSIAAGELVKDRN